MDEYVWKQFRGEQDRHVVPRSAVIAVQTGKYKQNERVVALCRKRLEMSAMQVYTHGIQCSDCMRKFPLRETKTLYAAIHRDGSLYFINEDKRAVLAEVQEKKYDLRFVTYRIDQRKKR